MPYDFPMANSGDGALPRAVILAIDDEPTVLRAVQRDLRSRFGERFRVMGADSGAAALELLSRLKVRGEPVALLMADQRMPGMTGVDLLEQALGLYPEAKRVLLTAYADTDAAIKAINDVDLDYYLLKPWDPPEEHLYPVVADLLGDWEARRAPEEAAVRLVGHRWSRESHELRDFLARNQIPSRFLEIERSPEARTLVQAAGPSEPRLPLVVFPDGMRMEAPTNLEVAEHVGLATQAKLPFYDLIVVGGGPAGLAAAVYGASEGLRTVMIEREAPGGQAGQSSRIENYLGFPHGLSGLDLARRADTQARRFGAEVIAVQEAASLEVRGPARVVRLTDGTELASHAVILATGVSYRRLEAPGVDELAGQGVYYGAAMTEAISCAEQDVFVVGGANSAGQAAMYFSRFARSVTILVRGESLEKSMSQYLIEQVRGTANIDVRPGTQVSAVHGNGHLEEITLSTGERVPAAALFIFIGAAPHTGWLGDLVMRDARGFVLSGPQLSDDGARPPGWNVDREPHLLETSVPGIFVAGDVRARSIKRVASAVGEGAMAVQFVHEYLADA